MPVSVCKTTHATVHRPFAHLSKYFPGARAQLQGNLARHRQGVSLFCMQGCPQLHALHASGHKPYADSASGGCGTYRCLGSGHGGGGINKRKSVSEHDGDNDRNRNPSWQIGLAVLVCTSKSSYCSDLPPRCKRSKQLLCMAAHVQGFKLACTHCSVAACARHFDLEVPS